MNIIHIYTEVKRQSFNDLAKAIGRKIHNERHNGIQIFSFDASFYAKSPRIAPRAVAIIVMLPNNHAKMASRSLDMFIRPERMRSSWAFLGLVPLAYAQSCFWEIPVIFSRVARENHPFSR